MKNPDDYSARINRAIDFVKRNLDQPLRLDDVAQVASFSSHHFHRIFRALVGETLHAFVKRTRLEQAIRLLSQPPKKTLTEVALACGFSSSSDFSRSFRAHFGVPPRAFDVEHYRKSQREKMQRQVAPSDPEHLARLESGSNPDGFEVVIRRLPKRRVAYIRVSDPYDPNNENGVSAAARKLLDWATERGLEGGQWLGYQWENPEITELSKCHYDVGLVIPTNVDTSLVSETTFAEMEVAEIELSGGVDLELRALDWFYTTWLPASGYVPDHHPGFEAFNSWPFEGGGEHFEFRVQIAVCPL